MPHSDHIIHLHRPKFLQKKLSTFDKVVLFISFAYPLSALPQALEVYRGNTEGVSIISWMAFLLCAGLFLVYGVKNKVFPMIVSNILWVIMDSLVVIGLTSTIVA